MSKNLKGLHFIYLEGSHEWNQLSAEKTMLITLAYLGTQTTMYEIADKFDVCESSAHTSIRRVLDFPIFVSAREIKWPNSNNIARNKRVFERPIAAEAWKPACQTSLRLSTDATSTYQDPPSQKKATSIEISSIQ